MRTNGRAQAAAAACPPRTDHRQRDNDRICRRARDVGRDLQFQDQLACSGQRIDLTKACLRVQVAGRHVLGRDQQADAAAAIDMAQPVQDGAHDGTAIAPALLAAVQSKPA
jgi:hypothetical protein